MKDNFRKIMKARFRKMNKKKKRFLGKMKNTGNSTVDASSNSEVKTLCNLSSKLNVLTEELFLSKKLERTLKNENLNLRNSLKKCTKDSNRLKNEEDMFNSKFKKNQSKIADLKQVIEDTNDKKTKQKQQNIK